MKAQNEAQAALTRRGMLRAAAWTAPAVTMAAAAPAYADSSAPIIVDPCPVASGQIRWSVGLSFTGLTTTNQWVSGWSSGSFTFRIGTTSGATTLAGVQYTSAASGLVAQVQDDEYYVTTPYAVAWDAAPSGWTITRITGNQWRFRRTDANTVKTGNVATPANRQVVSGQTGTLIPASPTFRATIVASSMANGQVVSGSVKVPVGAQLTRQVLNPTRPACDEPVQVRTPTESIEVTPAGVRTLAMAAPSTSNTATISASRTLTTLF